MLYVHIGIASMRQFQCVSTTYVTEKKVTMFEFTLQPRIMSIVFFLPLLNISNCQSVL